jgi:hypothetical protein
MEYRNKGAFGEEMMQQDIIADSINTDILTMRYYCLTIVSSTM